MLTPLSVGTPVIDGEGMLVREAVLVEVRCPAEKLDGAANSEALMGHISLGLSLRHGFPTAIHSIMLKRVSVSGGMHA